MATILFTIFVALKIRSQNLSGNIPGCNIYYFSECTECGTNYYLYNRYCYNCSINCFNCTSNNNCYGCDSGYEFNGGSCRVQNYQTASYEIGILIGVIGGSLALFYCYGRYVFKKLQRDAGENPQQDLMASQGIRLSTSQIEINHEPTILQGNGVPMSPNSNIEAMVILIPPPDQVDNILYADPSQ